MPELGNGRRVGDKILRASFVAMLTFGIFSTGINLWTYVSLQRAIDRAARNRSDMTKRFEIVNQNDDILASQLALLAKEIRLVSQQQDLINRQQRNWLRALEQPVRDRARQH